jgi:hypothetical protein
MIMIEQASENLEVYSCVQVSSVLQIKIMAAVTLLCIS